MTSSPEADPLLANVLAYNDGAVRYAVVRADRSFALPLYDRFARLVGVAGRVLDLGCGPCVDFDGLSAHGLRPVGCDASAGMLRAGLESGRCRGVLVRGDARALPFAAGAFAGVWACASLLHLPKAEVGAALAEAARVLRPGGILFTSMMAGEGAGLFQPAPGNPVRYRRHYAHYQPADWFARVSAAGFEVIDQNVGPPTEGMNPGATGWIETFARKR